MTLPEHPDIEAVAQRVKGGLRAMSENRDPYGPLRLLPQLVLDTYAVADYTEKAVKVVEMAQRTVRSADQAFRLLEQYPDLAGMTHTVLLKVDIEALRASLAELSGAPGA